MALLCEVEEILGYATFTIGDKPVLHWLIRWKGKSNDESTWEPMENVKHSKVWREYEFNRSQKIKRKRKRNSHTSDHDITTHKKKRQKLNNNDTKKPTPTSTPSQSNNTQTSSIPVIDLISDDDDDITMQHEIPTDSINNNHKKNPHLNQFNNRKHNLNKQTKNNRNHNHNHNHQTNKRRKRTLSNESQLRSRSPKKGLNHSSSNTTHSVSASSTSTSSASASVDKPVIPPILHRRKPQQHLLNDSNRKSNPRQTNIISKSKNKANGRSKPFTSRVPALSHRNKLPKGIQGQNRQINKRRNDKQRNRNKNDNALLIMLRGIDNGMTEKQLMRKLEENYGVIIVRMNRIINNRCTKMEITKSYKYDYLLSLSKKHQLFSKSLVIEPYRSDLDDNQSYHLNLNKKNENEERKHNGYDKHGRYKSPSSTPLPPSLPIPSPPKRFIYKTIKIRNIEEDEKGKVILTMKTVLNRETIFPPRFRVFGCDADIFMSGKELTGVRGHNNWFHPDLDVDQGDTTHNADMNSKEFNFPDTFSNL